MKNLNKFLFAFIAFAFHVADAQTQKKPWTFLVYVAADNNLNPEADVNINQMVQASKTAQNVNILVYLNIKRDNEDKKTQRLVISNGYMQQIGATTVEDSGDEKTLIRALEWAVTDFPSDHIAVDLWNHGSGSLNRCIKERGVCYDDSTGNFLSDIKYKAAFDQVVKVNRAGKKFDIIAFDACLMADLEVAYTLVNDAQYLASSQQTVPGPGFNYEYVLSLFSHQNPDPLTFAKWIVSSYDTMYKNSQESYTFSLIDLSKIQAVVDSTNAIANLLSKGVPTNSSFTQLISHCAAAPYCPHFDEPTYLDLYTFYTNLYNDLSKFTSAPTIKLPLKNVLKKALAAVKNSILANVASPDFAKANGMSIYFADPSYGMEPSYMQLYWTQANPAWANFLNFYIAAAA